MWNLKINNDSESEEEKHKRELDEIRRKTSAALDQIDWDRLDRHLPSSKAHEVLARIREQVTRNAYYKTSKLLDERKNNVFLTCYEELYPNPALNHSKPHKWMPQKLQVKGRIFTKSYQLLPWALGIFTAGMFLGRYSGTSPAGGATSREIPNP